MANPFALELSALHKQFDRVNVVAGVDLQLERGKRYALIGPNGAGKSSLFDLVSGRISPDAGRIILNGTDVTGWPPFKINRRGLARSFQISRLFPKMSVFENVRCAMLWQLGYRYSFWHRLKQLDDARTGARLILQKIGLASRENVAAGFLSYAEQRALEIGITIATGANVILLDEPTAGMNRSEASAMVELIRHVTEGKTLLMVEHDMQVAFGIADKIAVMAEGKIMACDTAGAIRANPDILSIYFHAEL